MKIFAPWSYSILRILWKILIFLLKNFRNFHQIYVVYCRKQNASIQIFNLLNLILTSDFSRAWTCTLAERTTCASKNNFLVFLPQHPKKLNSVAAEAVHLFWLSTATAITTKNEKKKSSTATATNQLMNVYLRPLLHLPLRAPDLYLILLSGHKNRVSMFGKTFDNFYQILRI